MANTLEDVVDVFGDPENTRTRFRDCSCPLLNRTCSRGKVVLLTIPSEVDTHEAGKADQCVTHQRNTSSLRGRAEESDLRLVGPKLLGVRQHGFPSSMTAGVLVVLDCGEVCAEAGISLDNAPESDL